MVSWMLSSKRPASSSTIAVPLPTASSSEGFHIVAGTEEYDQVQMTQDSFPDYKVYKRRWAGLAVLMGMNIITSWGVSHIFLSKYTVEVMHLTNQKLCYLVAHVCTC